MEFSFPPAGQAVQVVSRRPIPPGPLSTNNYTPKWLGCQSKTNRKDVKATLIE